MRGTLLKLAGVASLLCATSAAAQLAPDDVEGARRMLQQRVRAAEQPVAALLRQHRYSEAERLLDSQLRATPGDPELLALRVKLLMQAWRLDQAMRVAETLPNGKVLVGRIQLLEKKYAAALASAKAAQAANPRDAEAFLLEADVHFWNQQPDLADAPLRRALELDPLNADARFAYGYAIWRRVDARQLPQMAAQWNLALAIDPLHYVTHWHFGNGHTHLTYADYAQPSDTTVRRRMRGIDSLVAGGRLDDALRRTRALQQEFPESLLPDLARGSIFYMAAHLARATRLDSAQHIFTQLLARRPNYGPAHNALAAVIKQRQFTYHVSYDSLEAEIARQVVPGDSAFYREFRNIRYYPGDRVIRMAVQQLGPALAYLPFIARMGYTYVIPPLHHDLTEAMSNPFFRTSTTFDNRQWMDIRGSGGDHASAGIEYVERGSHQERVVLLHEYVHQFHGAVLTDQQNRRIRQLYHDAMAAHRTLDYYSANNESEFFAQAYEAYLTPVKVHPLNHKAMNTRADLITRDPQLFAFLDTLITENRAYLAGDAKAMRKNWAQVYVTLARQARASARGDSTLLSRAHALLDSAASFERAYVPALIERAAVLQAQRRWPEAASELDRAVAMAPAYAPVFEARAELLQARALAEKRNAYVTERVALYQKALALETDLAERAQLNRALRELYYEQGDYHAALTLAQSYADSAPTPSTYLRDRQDEAAAFAALLRSQTGHDETAFFTGLVARKPQNFLHRAQAIRAFAEAGDSARALQVLEEGERILRAGGSLPVGHRIMRAALQPSVATAAFADSLAAAGGTRLSHDERIRLAEYLLAGPKPERALQVLQDSAAVTPRQQADLQFVRAAAAQRRGDSGTALALLQAALTQNPYHVPARRLLVAALRDAGRLQEARRVAMNDVARLGLGKVYQSAIEASLNGRQ